MNSVALPSRTDKYPDDFTEEDVYIIKSSAKKEGISAFDGEVFIMRDALGDRVAMAPDFENLKNLCGDEGYILHSVH